MEGTYMPPLVTLPQLRHEFGRERSGLSGREQLPRWLPLEDSPQPVSLLNGHMTTVVLHASSRVQLCSHESILDLRK